MPLYEHTASSSKRYRKGERVRTVAGSVQDRRLAASDDWKAVGTDGEPAAPEPDHPAKSAPKGDWVDHAVDAGWDRDTANAKSKDELVALFAGGEG